MKQYLLNFLFFAACWVVASIFFTIAYTVTDIQYIWQYFILPALFMGIIGLIATWLKNKKTLKSRLNYIFIILAIIVDQSIKIYLFSKDWQKMSIPLVEPVFFISPSHNTYGSYLWSLLNLKMMSGWLNLILVVLIGFIIIEFWRFYKIKARNSFWLHGFIHLFLAGLACNVLDNILHGGSLDYLTIRPFYTTDLKDNFITTSILFMIR